MAIKIKGVIGWDVVGTTFADMFSRLSGDVDIELDTPGGFLSDGISIYNAIEDYNKGKVHITVVGQASSMGAYIMLAGDTLKFKSNSTVMLHNPLNCCCGDYIAMEKNADLLKRFSALYATKFVEKGIFKEEEIRSIMDATTFFIGAEELSVLGEVIKSDKSEPQDRETAIALAQENLKNCEARMRAIASEDFENVAALLPSAIQASANPQITNNETTQSNTNTEEKETIMVKDLTELQTKYPEIHAQAIQAGVEKEKSRVNALMKFIDTDKDAAVKAISDGKTIHDDEVYASFLQADIKASKIKAMEDGNPPDVAPQEPEHAPEDELNGDGDDSDKKAKEAKAKNDEKTFTQVMANFGIEVKAKV